MQVRHGDDLETNVLLSTQTNMRFSLQNHLNSSAVMLDALKLACNFAYQQPDHPLGFVGWSHTANQVMIDTNLYRPHKLQFCASLISVCE